MTEKRMFCYQKSTVWCWPAAGSHWRYRHGCGIASHKEEIPVYMITWEHMRINRLTCHDVTQPLALQTAPCFGTSHLRCYVHSVGVCRHFFWDCFQLNDSGPKFLISPRLPLSDSSNQIVFVVHQASSLLMKLKQCLFFCRLILDGQIITIPNKLV